MRKLIRFTVALGFLSSALPALATGHGNEGGIDEAVFTAPYTHRIVAAAPQLELGHGNDGGDLSLSRAGSVTRIEVAMPSSYEKVARRREAIVRSTDRTEDAGG